MRPSKLPKSSDGMPRLPEFDDAALDDDADEVALVEEREPLKNGSTSCKLGRESPANRGTPALEEEPPPPIDTDVDACAGSRAKKDAAPVPPKPPKGKSRMEEDPVTAAAPLVGRSGDKVELVKSLLKSEGGRSDKLGRGGTTMGGTVAARD